MHLVPAQLVPGTPAFAAAAAAASSTSAAAERGGQSTAAAPGEPVAKVPAGLAGSSLGSGSSVQRRGKHAAKLSISDLMAGEGLLGRLASEDGAMPGSQEPRQPPAGDSQPTEEAQQQSQQQAAQQQQKQQQGQEAETREEMVLLDHVPQQAYARIKLCRWVGTGL